MSVSGTRARRLKMSKSQSLKSFALEAGTVLNVLALEEQMTKGKDPVENDFLLCAKVSDGTTIKVPVREFNRFAVKSGTDLTKELEDGRELYPKSITIVSSEDRKTGVEGEKKSFYPTYAYSDADKFYESLKEETPMEWEDLIKSELKDPNPFSPVQNYTVEINH
jgi:hypothetical protein